MTDQQESGDKFLDEIMDDLLKLNEGDIEAAWDALHERADFTGERLHMAPVELVAKVLIKITVDRESRRVMTCEIDHETFEWVTPEAFDVEEATGIATATWTKWNHNPRPSHWSS